EQRRRRRGEGSVRGAGGAVCLARHVGGRTLRLRSSPGESRLTSSWIRPRSVSRRERGPAARNRAQTVTVTGEVVIHRVVRRKMAQPMERIARRSFGEVSLVLMPAKNNADANRTTANT